MMFLQVISAVMKDTCKRQGLKQKAKTISALLSAAKQHTHQRARQLNVPPLPTAHSHSESDIIVFDESTRVAVAVDGISSLEFTVGWTNYFEQSIRQCHVWCINSELLLPQDECDLLGDVVSSITANNTHY
jgi:hypothetical protein